MIFSQIPSIQCINKHAIIDNHHHRLLCLVSALIRKSTARAANISTIFVAAKLFHGKVSQVVIKQLSQFLKQPF